MAIPQGRLSTTLVEGQLLEPEGEQVWPRIAHERGPVAVEDNTEGLLYQNWEMTYNEYTGDFTATPDNAVGQVVLNALDVEFLSFTFDQNAKLTIAYSTSVSSFLWWYDSQVAGTVTTELGTDVVTPQVYLDDKRNTQNTVNDILLWFLRTNGPANDLIMLRQRDRYLTEYLMTDAVQSSAIQKVGQTNGLRIQLEMWNP